MIRSLFRGAALPLLSLLALGAGCSQTPDQQPTLLTGRISNPLDSVVTFLRTRDLISYADDTVGRLRLSQDGSFSLQIDTLTRPLELSMQHGSHSLRLLLEPHDSLRLTMDGQQPEKSLRYAGRGSGINTYYAELDRQSLISGFYGTPLAAGISHADTLLRRAERYRRQREAVLRQVDAQTPLSPAARRQAELATQYDYADLLLGYPGMYKYQAQKPLPGLDSTTYYAFVDNLAMPNDSALHIGEYTSFLSSYVLFRARQKGQAAALGGSESGTAYAEAANAALGDTRSRDFALAHHTYEALAFGSLKKAEPLVARFYKLNRDSALARLIRTEYANRQKLAPGQPAPEFALADSSGRTVSLSSFRGKAVYLDLWATWCGPCMQEMKVAPKLYQAMAGRDVAFVAVSLDDNEQAWRRWLRRNAAPGVVYLHAKGMSAPVAQAYQVQGIPSYWLIGPDGRIADNAPPRPSQLKEVQAAIEAVLPTRTAVARR